MSWFSTDVDDFVNNSLDLKVDVDDVVVDFILDGFIGVFCVVVLIIFEEVVYDIESVRECELLLLLMLL